MVFPRGFGEPNTRNLLFFVPWGLGELYISSEDGDSKELKVFFFQANETNGIRQGTKQT